MGNSTRNLGLIDTLCNYIVYVENKEGEVLSLKTLAYNKWHAREKVYSRLNHLQPDIYKYQFGVKLDKVKTLTNK